MQTKAQSKLDDEKNEEVDNEELVNSKTEETDEHALRVEEEERHASDHKRFLQRLHMRELAQKKAWAKENGEEEDEEEE